MSFRDMLHELGDRTARQILQLWQQVLDGELDADLFDELAAVIIATASAQGAAAAELSLQVVLEDAGVTPAIAAAGAAGAAAELTRRHYVNAGRLALAVHTARETPATAAVRLERLARSEPVESAQRAYAGELAAEPAVKGWKRDLDSDPCELCRDWYRSGAMFRPDQTMLTHTGCECSQRPVLHTVGRRG